MVYPTYTNVPAGEPDPTTPARGKTLVMLLSALVGSDGRGCCSLPVPPMYTAAAATENRSRAPTFPTLGGVVRGGWW